MDIQVARKWFRWAFINLAIVALYGAVMRYKIAFNFPFLEQKNLLHAHSHFAFAGWISHVLYSGLALLIAPFMNASGRRKYQWLILFNLFCAFGMLISFTMQGYNAVSICFSTASIATAIIFAVAFIKDAAHLPRRHPSKPWAVAALLLNILSSAGPFFLAYMMMSKNINHHYYLGSVYYYLHFQYSGWFFFGSMALIAEKIPATVSLHKYFKLFIIAVLPTFFLSILWAHLPLWLYMLTVIATLLQLVAWLALLFKLFPFIRQGRRNSSWINIFFYAAAIALTLKFLLQAISVIPSLSQLVFGIRSIVIAYLHLILLGVYSLFIIGYGFVRGFIYKSKIACRASFVFFAGVLLNELLLAVQGFAAFFYIPVPYVNEMLFAAAIILFSSAAFLALLQYGKIDSGK